MQIMVMLAAATLLGRVARYLRLPSVLGEILAGIVLGPTVLGAIFSAWNPKMFSASSDSFSIISAASQIGLIAFLFMAGLETDLNCLRDKAKGASIIGLSGIILPFSLGYGMVILMPDLWRTPVEDSSCFALFMGAALSISALPVIARILMDLDILRTYLGGIIMIAATANDILGWSIFALIVSGMKGGASWASELVITLVILAAAFLTIYLLRTKGDRMAAAFWSSAIDLLVLSMLILSLASQFTGGHNIVAAFLAGLILSEVPGKKAAILRKARIPVMFVLVPLYFTSIGIGIDFAGNFNMTITLLVFAIACARKMAGACLAARAAGLNARDALIIGLGLNGRGAMEIVLASIALNIGLIDGRIFFALVIMALATTMICSIGLPVLLKMSPVSLKAWQLLPLHEQVNSYNYFEH